MTKKIEKEIKESTKKENKKVLHLLTSNIYSGAENVAITIIEQLHENYNSIYACTDGPIINVLKEKNIEYIILKKASIRYIKKAVKRIKPDLIHAHGFQTSVKYSLSGLKIPYISHLHNNNPWLRKINLKSIMYLLAGIKAKKILLVSDSIEKEYVFSKYFKEKFINIGNPIGREKIINMVSEKEKAKKYDICCVGRLVEQKEPLKFIDIIKKIKLENPNIKALWVGDGELYNLCCEKVKSLNLEKNIEFIGFKKNPYQYMSQSQIFLLPSKWEGFGLVAFEALALGIPCVVSNVGGLPGIVNDSCGFLCNSEDEFVNSSLKLLNDNNKLMKYKENAIKQSKKIDNYKYYFKIIEETYVNVLK